MKNSTKNQQRTTIFYRKLIDNSQRDASLLAAVPDPHLLDGHRLIVHQVEMSVIDYYRLLGDLNTRTFFFTQPKPCVNYSGWCSPSGGTVFSVC